MCSDIKAGQAPGRAQPVSTRICHYAECQTISEKDDPLVDALK